MRVDDSVPGVIRDIHKWGIEVDARAIDQYVDTSEFVDDGPVHGLNGATVRNVRRISQHPVFAVLCRYFCQQLIALARAQAIDDDPVALARETPDQHRTETRCGSGYQNNFPVRQWQSS